MTQAVAAEAATLPWLVTVDTAATLADASGSFADTLPDAGAAPLDVRLGRRYPPHRGRAPNAWPAR